MNLHHRMIIVLSVIVTAAGFSAMFFMGNHKLTNDGVFIPVSVSGEISVDGGEFAPLDPAGTFDMTRHHRYRIRGHFSKDIEKNHQIMMRISDLWVRIAVSGRPVFAFGEDLEHSAGNVWQSFTSPGIMAEDEVEIDLYNIYTGVHPLSINQFLNEIHFGSVDGLFKTVLRQNGFSLLIGFLIFVIGICEASIGFVMLLLRQGWTCRIYYSAGFAIFSGIWFSIQFNIISLIIPYPVAVATADVLSPYLMSSFFSLYISTYLTGRLKCCGLFNSVVALLYTLLCIFLILFLKVDAYHTVPVGWTLAPLNLILSLLYLGAEYYKKHDREIRIFALSMLPILVGTLLDAYGYWSGTRNDTMWLRSCFLLFVIIQMTDIIREMNENARKAGRVQKLENELLQNRISVMFNQIQPHFLYNALNTIKYLCDTHADNAGEVVASFAKYLRRNLDSLTYKDLLTFDQELEHLNNYLTIERLRFPEIELCFDLETTDFRLPPLTLQPLVENAIRYGFKDQDGSGTVTISTRDREERWVLTIQDNGSGFDPEKEKRDGKSHIGIANTRERLALMCGGTLEIQSIAGRGTSVTISIPKEDARE